MTTASVSATSAVTWPDRWRRVPLWTIFERIKDVGHPAEEMLSVYRDHGVVKKDSRDDNMNKTAENRNIYQLVDDGWLVVNRMKAWQGSVGVSRYRGIVSGHYICFRPRHNENPHFLNYLFRSKPYTLEYQRLSRGVRPNQIEIDNDELRSIVVHLPPLEEQRRIADFLDAETRILDEVRAARQRMIELLVLKRDRLIDELVSGGQDAGAFVPLKYLVSSVSVGIVITPAAWYVEAEGVPALRGLNVKPGKIEVSNLVQISHEAHLLHRKSRLVAGDLVVVRTGQAGAAAVVPPELDGINCIDLVIVRPGGALISKFAEYLLNSSYAKRRVSEFAVGSIQAHFNVAAMKAMPVPKCSVTEQERRVAAIEEVARPIERTIERMREQDRLLTERRQALITAAVTGQIDVTTARGVD